MRVLFFGTYDVSTHPRVGVLIEGLRARGADVVECNAPLDIDTAGRVALLRQPWRLPVLASRLASRWALLARGVHRLSRRGWRPDAVVVGYLGHFDARLARLIFRRTPIALDHLISAADTARDRGLSGGGLKARLLTRIDDAAIRASDVVVVDTAEHRDLLRADVRDKAVVVRVGAPQAWFEAGDATAATPRSAGPLRVVFFGLYTPLQGAPVIGAALACLLRDNVDLDATLVGTGQDLAETRTAVGDHPRVRWIDWVPASQLPALVAGHDVCLGIFGTGAKARRVVPNKVFQGAAAGCVIVTSDTAPQREQLGERAVLVPPGDPAALAAAIATLAADSSRLAALKSAARDLARCEFTPARVVIPLEDRLRSLVATRLPVER